VPAGETPSLDAGWEAKLQLGFRHSGARTVLAHRSHRGPLTVQRPFYPEGEVCHVYLLHPPGGVVAGDRLAIAVSAATSSHALLTTPAASKFYRSDTGQQALQTVALTLAADAALEWLPQETIVYEGARMRSSMHISMASGARLLAWEILVLGRPAADEGFARGEAQLDWRIRLDGVPIFLETLRLDAAAFAARWGLGGQSSCGTLFAYPASETALQKVQALIGAQPGRGVTRMGQLLVCRAIDARADRLREFFGEVWALIRGDLLGREASSPRIWAT